MEEKLTVKSSFPLGDYDKQYGQTWLCQVDEQAHQVMFNTMDKNSVNTGDRLSYEEETVQHFKTGKNAGKEYRRLKKVTIEPGAISKTEQSQPNGVEQAVVELSARVVALEEKVKKLANEPDKDEVALDDIDLDEEVDLSAIPF